MLYLWWRMEEERRRRVWLLYGWFSGLMLCGSLFGAVAWAARMMILVNYYKGDNLESGRDYLQYYDSLSISYSLYPIFIVPYAIEFLCLSSAKLMVLDRMTDFAAGQDEGTRKRWAAGGRMVMAVVVLGNAVGLAANVAAAVQVQRSAEAASAASALFTANSTQLALESVLFSRTEAQLPLHCSRAVVVRGCCAAAHCCCVCGGGSCLRPRRQL